MHLYLRVSEGRHPGEGAGAIPSFGEIRILLKVFKGPWLEEGVGATMVGRLICNMYGC